MAQIIIKPEELQTEITTARGSNDKVKALKYKADKKSIQLTSMDKFLECLEALNSAITSFGNLTEMDLHTLEIVRGNWMKLDEDLATKTFGERVMDSLKK
ncbi:hypothetical protein [Clostridium manihotivorum]|uniref:Uncharacterized protein n=1 Tax=Clostridium manihotivorum TaxID=2320868 RepID=A0A410DZU0_9CLOT|nr:hypothetical protein [Clostridium manihotivorum]QAA34564.1 hypothetical protein C1I91_24640 [Clostridium manihotivorum]